MIKVLTADIKGKKFRALISKAAKAHVAYTVTYGLYMATVEAYCGTYCSVNCDFDSNEEPFIKTSIDFYEDSIWDLFK